MRRYLRAFSVGTTLAATLAMAQATGPEAGYWRASSQTARSITGDIAFSGDKLTINFLAFTIAHIRPLNTEETISAFNPDPGTQGSASLWRLRISAAQKF